jgi:hypothetical protein
MIARLPSGSITLDSDWPFWFHKNISYQERLRDWPDEARQPISTVPIPEDERGDDEFQEPPRREAFFMSVGYTERY